MLSHRWMILKLRIESIPHKLRYRWVHTTLYLESAEGKSDTPVSFRLDQSLEERHVQGVFLAEWIFILELVILRLRSKLLVVSDQYRVLNMRK